MHTITFKSDDEFYQILNTMVKSVNTTKSELIRQSVLYYQGVLEKEQLKQQIRQASLKVQGEALEIAKEFEDTLHDGLNNV